MAAGTRVDVILPGGEDAMVLSVGVGDAIGVQIIDRDGEARDLTSDSLAVSAKLDTTPKTLAFSKDSPNTDGKATLTFPADQLTAAGTLYVDLKWAKSGGEANIIARLEFVVEDSEAD